MSKSLWTTSLILLFSSFALAEIPEDFCQNTREVPTAGSVKIVQPCLEDPLSGDRYPILAFQAAKYDGANQSIAKEHAERICQRSGYGYNSLISFKTALNNSQDDTTYSRMGYNGVPNALRLNGLTYEFWERAQDGYFTEIECARR